MGRMPDLVRFCAMRELKMISVATLRLPIGRCILLGHSRGSFAAQQFVFVLDHSHSIDGLVLSGSGALYGLARLAQSAPAGRIR